MCSSCVIVSTCAWGEHLYRCSQIPFLHIVDTAHVMQVRSHVTLQQLNVWIHALTLEAHRALHTADQSDYEVVLAISRALEVLSRMSEVVDAELQ